MKRWMALASWGLVGLAGCLDLDNEFTMNPDGSGKVRVKCVMAAVNLDAGDKRPPEEVLKSQVKDTFLKSQGVDAWCDVSASVRDDGKFSFSGVAYFKDITKLKLNILGVESSGGELTFRRDPAGSVSVEMAGDKKNGPPPQPPGPLTDDQIKARMKEQRVKYQQTKPMMEAFLKEIKFRSRVHLPGEVGEVHNWKKVGANSVELGFDGTQMLKAMGDLIMDDAFLKQMVLEGRDMNAGGPGSDGPLAEKLFGENGPIKAVTKGPLKPSFDYEAEAAPARAGFPELQKKYSWVPGGTGDGRPAGR